MTQMFGHNAHDQMIIDIDPFEDVASRKRLSISQSILVRHATGLLKEADVSGLGHINTVQVTHSNYFQHHVIALSCIAAQGSGIRPRKDAAETVARTPNRFVGKQIKVVL